jgi:hypothetical protein
MKSRTYGIIGFAITTSLLLGGCTPIEQGIEKADKYAQDKLASISVPFEWFKNEEIIAKDLGEWKEPTALPLPDKDVTAEELQKNQEIVETLEKQILSPVKMKGFLGRARDSQSSFEVFSIEEGQPDVFGNVLREIHGTPHQKIESVTFTGTGHVWDEKDKEVLFVSLNVVNDNENFLVYPLMFTLNEQQQIDSVRQLKNESSLVATPSPLTNKSEWHESVHQEFSFAWKDFQSYPKTNEWASVNEDDFSSWLTTHSVEEREESVGTVHAWFKESEGDISRAKVTGYIHTDEQATALTLYEVSYPKKNSLEHQLMTVSYDRGLNKIKRIEMGSPFDSIEEGE